MKIKSKEGLPVYRKDSRLLQQSLRIWKEEVGEVKSRYNYTKEYWDQISSCRSL